MEPQHVCSVLGFAIFFLGRGKDFLRKLKIVLRKWKLLGKHKRDRERERG
jgi:hypothetical protein